MIQIRFRLIGVMLMLMLVLGMTSSCQHSGEQSVATELDVQGHRGARGYYPENSISGFLYAIELGVSTLELDVVISADSEVVVSHEPWFSPVICELDSVGGDEEETRHQYNLFDLSYPEIANIDCGSKGNPRFPSQKKIAESKPLLKEVFQEVQEALQTMNLPQVAYNIEIKSGPSGDGIFHPNPNTFVDLVMKEISIAELAPHCTIQSFDYRPLLVLQKQYPDISLSFLYNEPIAVWEVLDSIDLQVEILSPNYERVDTTLIRMAHQKGLKVIPWTVNDPQSIDQMIKLGVDGIISDYPDRVLKRI